MLILFCSMQSHDFKAPGSFVFNVRLVGKFLDQWMLAGDVATLGDSTLLALHITQRSWN